MSRQHSPSIADNDHTRWSSVEIACILLAGILCGAGGGAGATFLTHRASWLVITAAIAQGVVTGSGLAAVFFVTIHNRQQNRPAEQTALLSGQVI